MADEDTDDLPKRRSADKRSGYWKAVIGSLLVAAWLPLFTGIYNYGKLRNAVDNLSLALGQVQQANAAQWETIQPIQGAVKLNEQAIKVNGRILDQMTRALEKDLDGLEKDLDGLGVKLDTLILRMYTGKDIKPNSFIPHNINDLPVTMKPSPHKGEADG